MNWISIDEKMPELRSTSDDMLSDTVWLWVLDTEGNGFPTAGSYSSYWNGWLCDANGPLRIWGFKVTHWAEVEPPEAER